MSTKKKSLNIVFIMAIVVVSLTALVVLGQSRIFGIAQGQGNLSSSLTPEQKAAICDPSDTHINATESKICGKPATPSSNSTSSENVTTGAGVGAEVPSSQTAAAPSTGE